ncbi:hypothetical protein DsansV1_C04g0050191 [Dioscorea sansibarensis]
MMVSLALSTAITAFSLLIIINLQGSMRNSVFLCVFGGGSESILIDSLRVTCM